MAQLRRIGAAKQARKAMTATRTIAFMNQKGGVGKTTTAVNLAAALARTGRRVGVIDLDPQAHLTLHLGASVSDGRPSIYDVLVDESTLVDEAAVTLPQGLLLLPAETDLAGAEVELASAPDRASRLADRCAASKAIRGLDFLLIDCPPSLGLLTLNALSLAREVVVPMQAHFLALQGLSKLLETVALVGAGVNPHLRVSGVVLCMYEGHTRLAAEVVADLEGFLDAARDQPVPWSGCRILRPPIRRNIKLAECPSFGSSIFEYDAHCPGAEDYLALARDLAEGGAADTADADGGRDIERVEATPVVMTAPRGDGAAPRAAAATAAASESNAAS